MSIHYPDLRASVAPEAAGLLKQGSVVKVRLVGGEFELYLPDGPDAQTGPVIARSSSAKALSRYALDRDAAEVVHRYDLRFER